MRSLLPCPFCGADDAHVIGITATGESSVICYACGGETAHKATAAEALAAWNRRPAADAFNEAPAECDTCGGMVACPRCDAEPADAGRDALSPVAAALLRCHECWEDDEGSDVGRPMLDALTTLGYLQKIRRNCWGFTDAGQSIVRAALASQQAVKP